jgi:hypothetical protein
MRTTQRKGDIATSRAIATFTAMGFDVSIPLTESAAYDLIVDDGQQLARIQCKFTSDARRQVDLRRIHSNSSGYVMKRVVEGSYDWLYVLDEGNSEYLIKECLAERRSVNLRATLTSSERWQSLVYCSCLESSRPVDAGPGVRIPPAPLARTSRGRRPGRLNPLDPSGGRGFESHPRRLPGRSSNHLVASVRQ